MNSKPKYSCTVKEWIAQLLMLIPNLVKLLYRMISDNRVFVQEKVILLATVIYIFSPIDFVPDMIPVLGQVDDILLGTLVLKRFFNSVERSILLSHWDGNDNLLLTIDKILEIVRYILPKGVYDRIVNVHRPAA